MKKALKRHGSPEAVTTNGLRSCRAAMNELNNAGKQEVERWANNRAESSQPTSAFIPLIGGDTRQHAHRYARDGRSSLSTKLICRRIAGSTLPIALVVQTTGTGSRAGVDEHLAALPFRGSVPAGRLGIADQILHLVEQ